MFQKILYKASSIFYNIHLKLLKKAKRTGVAKPYQVRQVQSKASKTVIHFIGNFIVGGSSQLVVDIIERASDHYKHKIIVPYVPEPLPYQPLDIIGFSLLEIDKLYYYLRENKPGLVHVHFFVRDSNKFQEFDIWYQYVFKVCEELGIKIVQNINIPTYPYNNDAVAHNVFVSHFVRDHFNNSPDTPSSVIYPGSDFSHFIQSSPESLPRKVIGMVYRLDQDKLSKDSIEVFIEAVKMDKEIHCLIVGGGYFLQYYKDRVAAEGLDRHFTFTGYVSYIKLPEYYRKMSLFVAPVHDESFGQVTPFAMNMGLAVTGYDVGALKEILGYGDTLVAPGDVKKLAEVIVELASSDEKRISFGKKNQQRAKNFSVEDMIENYVALYQSIA